MNSCDVVFEDEALAGGFTQVWNCILEDTSLSVQARLLYTVFCRFGWAGDCHPGQERLGEIMGVLPRRVRDYVRELTEVGLITVHRRGLGKTNIYVIHAPVVRSRAVPSDWSGGPVGGDRSGGSGGTGLTRAGDKGLENTQLGKDRAHEKEETEEHPPPEDTPTPSGTNLNGTHAQSPDETQRSQPGTTRDFTPYSKEQQAGPGSEQKQRLAAKKRGERPKTPPPPAPAISQPGTEGMTKRQLRKARTKGEAEKWLARHTSTSSS